jgi:glycosyltransferase involved in cell wall biosynthesis
MKPIILTFAPLPPTIPGGIEEYAYSIINEMKRQGLDVRVITSGFSNNTPKKASLENSYFPIPSRIFFKRPVPINLFAFLTVAKAIRESDIILVHMPYPFVEAFAAIISKIFNKKIIVTYHMDAIIDTDTNTIYKKPVLYSLVEGAYRWFSAKWPLTVCDAICTNSVSYANFSPVLRQYMNKVKVVYQGISKELYDHLDDLSSKRMRWKYLGQDYNYMVTFVGRIVGYKGLPYLIDAIHYLRRTCDKKILFVIAGEGPQKQFLMELVREHNLTNVIFPGFISDEDLFNLLAASDLVVAPSISELESTPITLLSALMVGTPVIGTSIGGTGETIPNDGIRGSIIPIKESKILANTIDAMLSNRENQTRDIVKIAPRFWSGVTNDYLQIIHDILKVKIER